MAYLILLTFILAPAYVVKFNFLHLPTNILMLWVFVLWIVFVSWLVIKKQFLYYLNWRRGLDKKLLVLISLFLLSGIIGLFVNGIDRAKLGQFIVLFLQPISLFFIAGYIFHLNPKSKNLLLTTYYLALAVAGAYAILQYFTLIGLEPAWWGNSVEPKRAISFFVHPNFYALWCAPLLALLIPDLVNKLRVIPSASEESLKFSNPSNVKGSLHSSSDAFRVGRDDTHKIFFAACWLIGAAGLFLSLSRAGWFGLGAAVIIYLFIAADAKAKKMALGAAAVLFIIIFSIPNFRYRIILPFDGEKSTVSRFSLWQTGIKGIKENPILGIGLNGFSNQWEILNTDKGLTDTHNFPHNIFLDFWLETGLLGLISFIGVAWIGISIGLKNKQDAIKLGVALFLIALILQGQIDNPYFKNDLALVFWVVLSLVI